MDSDRVHESYDNLLKDLRDRYPRLADSLTTAHVSRVETLASLLDGARLRGVDELLRHLDAVAQVFDREPTLARISFLVRRAAADFETALEATLSSTISVAHEAMRDVMEIELLLLDFATEPARIDEWFQLTDSAS